MKIVDMKSLDAVRARSVSLVRPDRATVAGAVAGTGPRGT